MTFGEPLSLSGPSFFFLQNEIRDVVFKSCPAEDLGFQNMAWGLKGR